MRPPGRALTCFKEYLVEITVIYTSPPPGVATNFYLLAAVAISYPERTITSPWGRLSEDWQ